MTQEEWARCEKDAQLARRYAEASLDYNDPLRRSYGSEQLVAVAQVYATLSTRPA